MGGRGASGAGKHGKIGGAYSYYTEGNAGNYQEKADAIIDSVKTVLSDFGAESALTGITFSDATKESQNAAVNGFGQLKISKKYLANGESSSNGYFVNDTYAGTGAHEAGHMVNNYLLRSKVMPNASNLEQATAYRKGKLEKAILKEAQKRYGSNPQISKYGSKNAAEKIAEAVSDVYTNKQKSHPYSREIVSVMKDINTGKFIPNIKVTKSEMGI